MRFCHSFRSGIPLFRAGHQRVTHPFATNVLLHPFDLHVLGTPPAFILSQDQTLRRIFSIFRSFIFRFDSPELSGLFLFLLLLNCQGSASPSSLSCFPTARLYYMSFSFLVNPFSLFPCLPLLSSHPARFIKQNSNIYKTC